MTDADLFARLERGDAAAWEEFDRSHRPWLLRRIERTRRVRNWFWVTDPEDLAQEAMDQFAIQVRGGKFQFASEPELRTYLIRAAFFVAMKWKRAARIQVKPLGNGAELDALEHAPAVDWVQAAWIQSERYRCLERLAEAAARLLDGRRRVIQLTLLGWKVGDIARTLGKTTGAVSCLKFNALKQLRDELESSTFMDECGSTLDLEHRRPA